MLHYDFDTASTEKPIIRSNAHDIQWYLAYLASVNTLANVVEELEKRLDVLGQKEEFTNAVIELNRIGNEMIETFPVEKRRTLNNQAAAMEFQITVGPSVVRSPTFTRIDVDVMGTLIDYAHEMNCQLCDHPRSCNQCDLGKAFDKCLPEDRGRNESWAEIDVTKNA